MDFIKKHGEKLLFLLLLIGLALSVFLAMNAKSNLQRTVDVSPNAGKVELTIDTSSVQDLIAQLENPSDGLKITTDAFTPGVRVICMNPRDKTLIPVDAKICPYCGYEQTVRDRDTDGDGIFDKQEAIWGMNPNDPKDVFLDQDSDGFTTLVEFQNGTDPTNSSDYPPLINYVRLKDVVESSIDFELRGIAKLGDFHMLQLYWKYPDEDRGQVERIREGNTFGRNNEFLVASYTDKRTLIDGKFVDQSEALIRSGSHELVLDREGDGRKGKITESTATLHTILGPEWETDVRVNQTVELDKKSYIIVDINRTTVVMKPSVLPESSTEIIKIQKASAEEIEAMKPAEPEMPGAGEGLGFDFQNMFN
ncbi:MAG: hypothetical protein ACO3N7_00935 [Kiritimatiellia bacterium]